MCASNKPKEKKTRTEIENKLAWDRRYFKDFEAKWQMRSSRVKKYRNLIEISKEELEVLETIINKTEKEIAELEVILLANGFKPFKGDISNYKNNLETIKVGINVIMNNANDDSVKIFFKELFEKIKNTIDRYYEAGICIDESKEEMYRIKTSIKSIEMCLSEI